MKTAIAIGGVLLVIVLVLAGSYISNYNYGNAAEKTIVAEYTNMENILGQYSLKVKEAVQVPEMKTDDLSRVMREAMTGRYGPDGSKAAFQWIQENYPGQVSDALYTQIQQIMEAGRNKFENAQTKFIDTKRAYETNLGYFWKGMWLRIAGYPTINLDDYKIITSSHAQQAFQSGVDQPIQLRGPQPAKPGF
jgi:hypothetical protein